MKSSHKNVVAYSLRHVALLGGLMMGVLAQAGMVTDRHGTVGYDTAAECDAAVASGQARYYQPVTVDKPVRRAGEVSVRQMPIRRLAEVGTEPAGALGYSSAGYVQGACDLGTPSVGGREHVTPQLVGKYVPFSPDMMVNVFYDRQGRARRVSMAQCDNSFQASWPRPVGVTTVAVAPPLVPAAPVACYVDALRPIVPVATPGCGEGMRCHELLPLPPSRLPGVERSGAMQACTNS